jgi:transcriptional regulator with XRE-family HTH domain
MRIFFKGISFIIWLVASKNIVGPQVRLARKEANPPVTQLDLVARLQTLGMTIDQSGLSKLENGNRPVSDKEVVALAEALRVPVSWLLKTETNNKDT